MSEMIKAEAYCERVFDGTHDTPKPQESGYKLITSKNIKEYKLDIESAYFISQEDYDAINNRSKVSQYDILFSMIGTVGTLYIERADKVEYAIKNIGVFSCLNQKRADYLYYFLQSPFAKNHISRYLNGAVQKFLPLKALREFPVPIFEEEKYQLIKVLLDIDQKITLNNQINQELEAMAKTLYDYWFVQFDFPDENGKPYKSSGGKMVYNDQLKREIPEGWGVPLLSDVSKYVTDKISVANLDSENYIGTDNMIAGMKGIRLAQYLPIDTMATKYTVGDVLISNIRPYFKKIWQAERNGGCSSDVLCIRSNVEALSEFIYTSLARDDFFSYNVAGSKGSKMPRGDKKHIMNYKLVYDDLLARFFSSTVRPFYEKIAENNKQNQELSRLRDWLLPMLMNGQVRVE